MTRPQEHDFVSHVAYTRALEEYCNFLESESFGDDEHDGQPDEAQEWESFDPDC